MSFLKRNELVLLYSTYSRRNAPIHALDLKITKPLAKKSRMSSQRTAALQPNCPPVDLLDAHPVAPQTHVDPTDAVERVHAAPSTPV